MPRPIDMLPNFKPIRRVVETTGTHVIVGVQPPKWMEIPERQITLSTEQYHRYVRWLAYGGLIQEILPELTASQREALLTGLDDENFPRDQDG